MLDRDISRAEIVGLLREPDPEGLSMLWRAANDARQRHVGEDVHLRGLVEISNVCRRSCMYCGLRVQNRRLRRYRMTAEEIIACANRIRGSGCGTVVLQAGEDPGINMLWLAEVVRLIKRETGLAVTLSLGERDERELLAWRAAGADRYLLRFETSDRALFDRIHPAHPAGKVDRLKHLRLLHAMGYEIGGGIMVGIPGQTCESVARDIALFRALDMDMIGIGPYLAHPDTPLGKAGRPVSSLRRGQVPCDTLTTLKVVALARIVCPEANIPSTTALATADPVEGRDTALARGANVVMPIFTPAPYRALYEIYPGKGQGRIHGAVAVEDLQRSLARAGRRVGTGPGGRRRGTLSRQPGIAERGAPP